MKATIKMSKFSRRRLSRSFAMRCIYPSQLGLHLDKTLIEYLAEVDKKNYLKMDFEYFEELYSGVVANLGKLEELLLPFLSKTVNPVEKSILLVAVFELLKMRADVPIIIDEALEITKVFAGRNSYRFVNGVLENVHAKLSSPTSEDNQ